MEGFVKLSQRVKCWKNRALGKIYIKLNLKQCEINLLAVFFGPTRKAG